MKILFIGDIVGRLGRKTIARLVPKLKRKYKTDYIVANAENSAHGSGITENIIDELEKAKIDFFTLGDHAFRNKKSYDLFEKNNIIRPANFPASVPGVGSAIAKIKDKNVLFISLIGRVLMKADYDCPFRKLDEILANNNLQGNSIFAIIIDIHAETTSEKQCMKYYSDGRVSAILGTHTHVQTADACVTSKGTAFITDVGMTGFSEGSLGLDAEDIIKTFLTQIRHKHVIPEKGKAVLNAVLLDLNDRTGRVKSIKTIAEYTTFK